MPLLTYLLYPGFNDLDHSRRWVATPLLSDRWRLNFLGGIGGRWVDAQPSSVRVRIPQTERATSLAPLKTLGRKVEALSWTPSQRSAFWVLRRV
jgi:hypothetical protein